MSSFVVSSANRIVKGFVGAVLLSTMKWWGIFVVGITAIIMFSPVMSKAS